MSGISADEVEALFSKINELLPNLSAQQYGLLAAVFKIANDISAGELKFDQVAFSEEFDTSFAPLTPFPLDTAQMILAYAEVAADVSPHSRIVGSPTVIQSTKPPKIFRSISKQPTDSDE